jgi:hypothetical protein
VDDYQTNDGAARIVPCDEIVAEAMPTNAAGRARWLWRVDDYRTNDGAARIVPCDEIVAGAMPTNAAGRARWLWREDSNLRPPD